MHRSRLATIVIDCAAQDYEQGLDFWSHAMGKELVPTDGPRSTFLRGRVGGEGGPCLLRCSGGPEGFSGQRCRVGRRPVARACGWAVSTRQDRMRAVH